MSAQILTPGRLGEFLGPLQVPPPPEVSVEAEAAVDVQDGAGYVRRHVTYSVPSGRASAFVCIPVDLDAPAPVVFCHHQHNGQFDLGKSEVCGLRGDPDQAYAAELASHGFITIAPDAIGFEDRNWAGAENVTWFELASRLVMGRTLLADCLQEISIALDYVVSLPEADSTRIGFIGHSYGGRMALWAPAWDRRITASVSNCGCVPYRESFTHDTGVQAELVVPGFAARHDLEDVLALADQCRYLVLAADGDRWSRGAEGIRDTLQARCARRVRVEIRPGGHDFPRWIRAKAYEFLTDALSDH